MKIRVLVLILLLHSLLTPMYISGSSDLEFTKASYCMYSFKRYSIDVSVKSSSGWLRVCNNDKLGLYTDAPLTPEAKRLLCECFEKTIKSRSVEIIRKRSKL